MPVQQTPSPLAKFQQHKTATEEDTDNINVQNENSGRTYAVRTPGRFQRTDRDD